MIGDIDPRKPGAKADLLQALRTDYEARGFSFVAEPEADALPAFLGGFRPDPSHGHRDATSPSW